MMRALVKNEATGRKIKEAVLKKMREEGEAGLDSEGSILVDANPTFIRVIIDKRGSASQVVVDASLDDMVPEYDAEDYLFGKADVMDDSDEDLVSGEDADSLKKYDKDIKGIIEEVITGVAPLE
jgi:hypothetical protein